MAIFSDTHNMKHLLSVSVICVVAFFHVPELLLHVEIECKGIHLQYFFQKSSLTISTYATESLNEGESRQQFLLEFQGTA